MPRRRRSRRSGYRHIRRRSPKHFVRTSFRTVPVSHVKTRKSYPKGSKAVVGKLRRKHRNGKWGTQSILVKK